MTLLPPALLLNYATALDAFPLHYQNIIFVDDYLFSCRYKIFIFITC